MDFVFKSLSVKQFRDVRKLYGNVGRAQPKRGQSDYRLIDFMSPLIQALDGKVFKDIHSDVPQINAGRTGAYGTENAPVDSRVCTSTNCWSTLFAVLKDLDTKESKSSRDYALFYSGRLEADRVLRKISAPVAEIAVKQADADLPTTGSKMAFGDLLLVKTKRRLVKDVIRSANGSIISSTPGKLVTLLEHAGLAVDENLIFEKVDGGSKLPFRLVSLADSVAPYLHRSRLELQIRRRNSVAIPHARDAFGGTAHAAEPCYAKHLSLPLRNRLVLSKELGFPDEGVYYHTWNQLVELDIRLNPKTKRFGLGPEASSSSTYQQQLLPK